MATSTIKDSLAKNWTSSSVTVTPKTNVVIDTNKSQKMGRLLFLYVKGHTTGTISNTEIFSFSNAVASPGFITFPLGTGDAWGINGSGYGYLGTNSVTATLASGVYFHIAQCFLCEA